MTFRLSLSDVGYSEGENGPESGRANKRRRDSTGKIREGKVPGSLIMPKPRRKQKRSTGICSAVAQKQDVCAICFQVRGWG